MFVCIFTVFAWGLRPHISSPHLPWPNERTHWKACVHSGSIHWWCHIPLIYPHCHVHLVLHSIRFIWQPGVATSPPNGSNILFFAALPRSMSKVWGKTCHCHHAQHGIMYCYWRVAGGRCVMCQITPKAIWNYFRRTRRTPLQMATMIDRTYAKSAAGCGVTIWYLLTYIYRDMFTNNYI